MPVLEVSGLTKDYGGGHGIFDVSFQVDRSEVFGFLGPNGAGKSTTIRHLMGFSHPDRGTAKIFGKSASQDYGSILKQVGYIPGEIALPAGLTGLEFLRMMQGMQKNASEERLQMLLKRFDLDPSGETKRMSLGVKRKLAIVAACMNDPEVLILDEPTSGLDPVMQEVFVDFIREEKDRGKTVLLSSHIFSEVDALCDRIAIIKDGHLVSVFQADALRHAQIKSYEAAFYLPKDLQRWIDQNQGNPYFKIAEVDRQHLRAVLMVEEQNTNAMIQILSDYTLKDFKQRKETLEDYFMRYYREDQEFKGVR